MSEGYTENEKAKGNVQECNAMFVLLLVFSSSQHTAVFLEKLSETGVANAHTMATICNIVQLWSLARPIFRQNHLLYPRATVGAIVSTWAEFERVQAGCLHQREILIDIFCGLETAWKISGCPTLAADSLLMGRASSAIKKAFRLSNFKGTAMYQLGTVRRDLTRLLSNQWQDGNKFFWSAKSFLDQILCDHESAKYQTLLACWSE